MTASASRTVEGVFEVDVEAEVVLGEVDAPSTTSRSSVELPRLVAASAAGSTVVAVVDRRPPLARLRTTPARPGTRRAAACRRASTSRSTPAAPDRILYAARNRLYLSTDGGRFWRSLAPELPDIEAVAWGGLGSPP